MKLQVRVIPNARRTAVMRGNEGLLLLKVSEPARDGKANRAVALCLSRIFRVPKTSVQLLAGEKSRLKRYEIIGLDAGLAERILAGLPEES